MLQQHVIPWNTALGVGVVAAAFLGILAMLGFSPAPVRPAAPLWQAAAVQPETEPEWVIQLRAMDAALVQTDFGAAEAGWEKARFAAHHMRGWAEMIAVGDAALRLGSVVGRQDAFESRARMAYLAAALRARDQRSSTGLAMASEALGALGDRSVAERGIRLAKTLPDTPGDDRLRGAVLALREGSSARLFEAPGRPRVP